MSNGNEVLEKKNEILKRSISKMLQKNNSGDLSAQEMILMNKFIRELHANNHSLNTGD